MSESKATRNRRLMALRDYFRQTGGRNREVITTASGTRLGKPLKAKKNPTKAERAVARQKASAKRRVADALANYLRKQNPAVETVGAKVEKLKGGVLKITPIKLNAAGRSARYSVSTADSNGEVGQIWAKTKAQALKEARKIYGTYGDRDSLGRPRKVAVYVRKLYGG